MFIVIQKPNSNKVFLSYLILPPLIGSTIFQTSKFIVFRNTSVVFLNINNKRHLSVHPKEYISFGKGASISFFNFLVLIPYFLVVLQYCFRHCAFCNLDWGITIYYHFKFKKKSSMILDLHRECTTINNFNLISIQQVQDK